MCIRVTLSMLLVSALTANLASGQSDPPGPIVDSWGQRSNGYGPAINTSGANASIQNNSMQRAVAPSAALRPLSSPSLVNQYQPSGYRRPETGVVRTAYQVVGDHQAMGQPNLVGQPSVNPNYPASQPIASMGNSTVVSPPSSWTANGTMDCVPTSATTVPRQYVPPEQYNPAVLTPDVAPNAYAPQNGGYRPLIALGSPYPNVQVGRGIIGQPTVYVPGQPIRNFFRYLSP